MLDRARPPFQSGGRVTGLMRRKVKWEAVDGKEFSTRAEALAYEAEKWYPMQMLKFMTTQAGWMPDDARDLMENNPELFAAMWDKAREFVKIFEPVTRRPVGRPPAKK